MSKLIELKEQFKKHGINYTEDTETQVSISSDFEKLMLPEIKNILKDEYFTCSGSLSPNRDNHKSIQKMFIMERPLITT